MLTNDNFTAAIEASHRVNSEIYSLDFEKRNRSEKLQKEVDDWLANKANKINDLPMGFTQFKDGNLPKCKKSAQENKAKEDQKKKEIELKNKQIREQKAEIKKQKAFQASERKKERNRLRAKVKREKVRAEKNKIKPKAKELKLVTFPERDEYFRKTMMQMLRKTAKDKGKKSFTGKCKHHGWIKFNIEVHNVRCTGCMADRAAALRAKSKCESNKAKSEKQKQAIAEGKTTFKAKCKHHGETTYAIRNTGSPVCMLCRKDTEKKGNIRTKEIRKKKNTYFYELKNARDEAKAKGLKSFDFKCKKCGDYEQRIRTDGTSYCVTCSKEKDRLRRNGMRLSYNNAEKEKAVAEGKSDFIGSCEKHGETRFNVYYEKEKSRYRCADCVLESQREVRESNKQNTAQCQKRNFFNNFFEKNTHITKKDFYKMIGWSKSAFHNYLSGTNEISDHKFNEFVEFINGLEVEL